MNLALRALHEAMNDARLGHISIEIQHYQLNRHDERLKITNTINDWVVVVTDHDGLFFISKYIMKPQIGNHFIDMCHNNDFDTVVRTILTDLGIQCSFHNM